MTSSCSIRFLPPPHDSDELGVIFTVPPANTAQPEPTTASGGTASAEEATQASEPHFILQQHKLGVSVHSIHPLVNEAREAFPAARRDYFLAREEGKDVSGGNPDGVRGGGGGEAEAAGTLLCVTRALLLVNADHGSAWNARKKLVSDGVYGNVRGEIKVR